MRAGVNNDGRRKVKWISVEGLIGAGKTTYLTLMLPILKAYYGEDAVAYVPEPVEKWLVHGHLAKAVEEAYVAQSYFCTTRVDGMLNVLEKYPKATIIISERSMMTDRMVFWNVTVENGFATPLAQITYPEFWSLMSKLLPGPVNMYLYLKTPPSQCQAQMRKRGRPEEQDVVTIKYQEQLEKAHDDLYGPGSELALRNQVYQVASITNYMDSPDTVAQMGNDLIRKIELIEPISI